MGREVKLCEASEPTVEKNMMSRGAGPDQPAAAGSSIATRPGNPWHCLQVFRQRRTSLSAVRSAIHSAEVRMRTFGEIGLLVRMRSGSDVSCRSFGCEAMYSAIFRI